jgi:hypothetical protein
MWAADNNCEWDNKCFFGNKTKRMKIKFLMMMEKIFYFPFLEPSPADAEFSFEFFIVPISLKTKIIINSCIRDIVFCSVFEYVCVYLEY